MVTAFGEAVNVFRESSLRKGWRTEAKQRVSVLVTHQSHLWILTHTQAHTRARTGTHARMHRHVYARQNWNRWKSSILASVDSESSDRKPRALYNLMAAQGHSVGQPELRTTGAGVKVRRESGGRQNEVALFPNLEERWPSGFLFKVPLSHPSSVSSFCRFCQYLVNTLRPSHRFSRHVSLLCNVPESKGVRTERKPLFLFRLQTFFSREYAAENEIPYETPTCKLI